MIIDELTRLGYHTKYGKPFGKNSLFELRATKSILEYIPLTEQQNASVMAPATIMRPGTHLKSSGFLEDALL